MGLKNKLKDIIWNTIQWLMFFTIIILINVIVFLFNLWLFNITIGLSSISSIITIKTIVYVVIITTLLALICCIITKKQ